MNSFFPPSLQILVLYQLPSRQKTKDIIFKDFILAEKCCASVHVTWSLK